MFYISNNISERLFLGIRTIFHLNIFVIKTKTTDRCISTIISENKTIFLSQNATCDEEYQLSRNIYYFEMIKGSK